MYQRKETSTTRPTAVHGPTKKARVSSRLAAMTFLADLLSDLAQSRSTKTSLMQLGGSCLAEAWLKMPNLLWEAEQARS